jgi:hypothetical protein
LVVSPLKQKFGKQSRNGQRPCAKAGIWNVEKPKARAPRRPRTGGHQSSQGTRKVRTFFDGFYKTDKIGILNILLFCHNLQDCHGAIGPDHWCGSGKRGVAPASVRDDSGARPSGLTPIKRKGASCENGAVSVLRHWSGPGLVCGVAKRAAAAPARTHGVSPVSQQLDLDCY